MHCVVSGEKIGFGHGYLYRICARQTAILDYTFTITTMTGGGLPVVNVDSHHLHISLAGVILMEVW